MNHTSELVVEKHYDPVGARVGMWLFLFTELLLFGGLFLLYAIYLNKYPDEFHYASGQLDQFVGALNTIILLTSSLTMVLSVGALQRNSTKLSILFLVMTLLLAAAFLVNKYFEWGHKFHLGIYPNSPELIQHPQGEIIFYGLYYTMTGLHGLHVIVGMVIMIFLLIFIARKRSNLLTFNPESMEKLHGKKLVLSVSQGEKIWESDQIPEDMNGIDVVVKGVVSQEKMKSNVVKLENSGLYWHLVDIIWIFLFPLFYLIAM
jgi:cytochrome c oxidase subunit 3